MKEKNLLEQTIEAIEKETDLIKNKGSVDFDIHYKLMYKCSISHNEEAMKLWIDHVMKHFGTLGSMMSVKLAKDWLDSYITTEMTLYQPHSLTERII